MRSKNHILVSTKNNFFIVLGLCLGLFILFQMIGFDFSKLPGDLGDTIFNLYILEHFYQFILGNVDSFWSAPFYFPYQNTIAFSDSHLGSAPIYSLLRILGLKQTLSLQFWIIIGYLLNYVFSSYVLKKLGLNSISAALGGFLFSFGLPVLAQQNHIQLTYRFLCQLPVIYCRDLQSSQLSLPLLFY